MSLVVSDFYTKIPYVGCPLEINDIYADYKKESKELDKDSKTLRAMRKQFKLERERSNNSFQKKQLEKNIKNVDSALEKQSSKLEKVKTKAFKDAGIAILQEGANMAMPGAGSVVAGLNRASSTLFFENNNQTNLSEAAQDGFLAGAKDFILSTGADLAADGCSIQ